MANGKFVAYYRVSTKAQGQSGLGLEAQKKAVQDYLNGGRWKLVAEFTEVESGKKDKRPQLHAALTSCRVYGARLVIAKLDRLSRDAHFLLGLEKAGVDFVAADMPDANKLTVGILALVAQQEREAISARTKAALAAAKARGKILGGHRPGALRRADVGRAESAKMRSDKARSRAADIMPIIEEIRTEGVTSANGIAKELNERCIPTARGGMWQAVTVQRLLAFA
ncbi:MAG: recombinase family protein [Candidatus Hydrogenedentales bacterium]|jgi:DNA invertase Pin-like site-specific DNA recombinase